jgi:beta-barrel assembly-enhancing protease
MRNVLRKALIGMRLDSGDAMSTFSTRRYLTCVPTLILTCAIATASGQSRITAPKNKYSPADDVKLGLQAADEAKKQLPMLNNDRIDSYVEDVGRRLAAAIPAEFQHPEFRFTFDVVNQKEINAFALPGGPMFLNRGMIEASANEAEMAGVMAHEISHVALRHGTAQATKGEKFQIGAVAGQILGAIVGGTAGSVIAQGSQFGLGAYFLKYSREYESQADILGAQILARAGYDPRQMANMFKTIEKEGGRSGPEWLSSHPNPGNRYEAINREASMLRVQGSAPNNAQFAQIKSQLTGMSPAYTAEQIAKGQSGTTHEPIGTSGRTVNVAPPSNQYRSYQPGSFMRLSVPANWQQLGGGNTVTYAPEGAVFEGHNGGSAFTHGLEVGVAGQGSGNLQRDTEALIQSFAQTNPQLRRATGYSRVNIDGRNGLSTTLRNVSDVTGTTEVVNITTTQLRDGSLLFLIGVAPETEAQTYLTTFGRVRQSVDLADR